MTGRPSWKAIAELLAERLSHAAYCNEHPVAGPDLECPSCDDRRVYAVYLDAGGRDFRPVSPPNSRGLGLKEIQQLFAEKEEKGSSSGGAS